MPVAIRFDLGTDVWVEAYGEGVVLSRSFQQGVSLYVVMFTGKSTRDWLMNHSVSRHGLHIVREEDMCYLEDTSC